MNKQTFKLCLLGVLSLGLVSLNSCSKDSTSSTVQTQISGVAEKGIFAKGATVTITVYKDDAFETVLNTLTGSVTGDDGSYNIVGDIKSKYVKIVVSGQYTDETSPLNAQVDGEISALASVESSDTVNVNVLTDLQTQATLVKLKAGKKFADAQNEALTDLLPQLGLSDDQVSKIVALGANKIKLADGSSSSTEKDALLSVSACLIQAAKSEGQDVKSYLADIKSNIQASKNDAVKASLSKAKAELGEVKAQLDDIKGRISAVKAGLKGLKVAFTDQFKVKLYLAFLSGNLNSDAPLYTLATAELKEIQTSQRISDDDMTTIKNALSTANGLNSLNNSNSTLMGTFSNGIQARLATDTWTSQLGKMMLAKSFLAMYHTTIDIKKIAVSLNTVDGKEYIYLLGFTQDFLDSIKASLTDQATQLSTTIDVV